jgi:hypothetical protein
MAVEVGAAEVVVLVAGVVATEVVEVADETELVLEVEAAVVEVEVDEDTDEDAELEVVVVVAEEVE